MKPYFLIFCIFILRRSATSQSINESKDNSVFIAQGEKLHLSCPSDSTIIFCQWSVHGEESCNLSSDDFDTATECKSNNRIMWDVTENSCGIYIDQVTREDAGNYSCLLFTTTTESSSQDFQVDVGVQPALNFTGALNSESTFEVRDSEPFVFECRATGGHPAPLLRASLGQTEGPISNDPKLDHILQEIDSQETINPDGTVDITKKFNVMVQSHDCGKFIKCEATQISPDGKSLTGKNGFAIMRKLSVLFPPVAPLTPYGPINFGPKDTAKEVRFSFMANPAPNNNQAIWHINPSHQVDSDSIVVQAGSSYRSKYEALPLSVTGHQIEAVLRMNDLEPVEADYEYYLEVSTDEGAQRYPFTLKYDESSIENAADPGPDTDSLVEGGNDDDSSKMGAGVIVGLVVLIFVILGAVAGTFWLKSKNKWCFAEGTPKNPQVNQQVNHNPEAEALKQDSGV